MFWIAREKYGKKELRYEEYQDYFEEWNNYTCETKRLIRYINALEYKRTVSWKVQAISDIQTKDEKNKQQ